MAPIYCMVKLFQKASYERLKRRLLDLDKDSDESAKAKEQHDAPPEGQPETQAVITMAPAPVVPLEPIELIQMGDKCRICLKAGNIPIFPDNGSSSIAEAIRTFTDISVTNEDGYPQHICKSCNRLLQSAILLRRMAKKSNKILHETIFIKQEPQDELPIYEPVIKKEKVTKLTKKQPIYENFFVPVEMDAQGNLVKVKSHSDLLQIPKVQCQICQNVVTKSYYKEHFSIHEVTLIKHVCEVCGKNFRLKSAYRSHMFTHSREFPYKCQLCPYRGRHSGLLKTHMKTHSQDPKHQCTECSAQFVFKCNLNRHMQRHKSPDFQCKNCQRMFHSKLQLDRHFQVEHMGVKNHICHLCGKAFGYRKGMMRHQLKVHKREKKLMGRTPTYLQAEYQN